ncbi:CocE/serine esterase [Chloropicon primus]|uniref:CocE/serine esterase n=1 Tax=Chloropicon primus TaxID=1764295 RepID=A0A5B8MK96_9CHLO|nr:CocE/serine esterase [Chloropicon primus]UPQ99903.1 CocE/serine esterase [Chloropicon primus]|mmetsp:Transcript_759/g.2222  ORF Transcript_759/g.2222 Transcript_759/m.2222 type:complete len:716 (-) Transcript_759:1706-3853(-)|eukprot:QDZ20691.1 CocE/serine esterase [Chloropicon primus]
MKALLSGLLGLGGGGGGEAQEAQEPAAQQTGTTTVPFLEEREGAAATGSRHPLDPRGALERLRHSRKLKQRRANNQDRHWNVKEIEGVLPKEGWFPRKKAPRCETYMVTMADGVELAVDVILPPERAGAPGEKIPCVFHQTRYYRQWRLRKVLRPIEPFPMDPINLSFKKAFTNSGFAIVSVDVRGTGASFGQWSAPCQPKEREDSVEMLNWISQQSWCNGSIFCYGISYDAMAAMFTVSYKHPNVKACASLFSYFDVYSDLGAPGGVLLKYFFDNWNQLVHALDSGRLIEAPPPIGASFVAGFKGVKGVSKALVKKALESHETADLSEATRQVINRDDHPDALRGLKMDDSSPYTRHRELRESNVPFFLVAGWLDGSARSSINVFWHCARDSGSRLIIGPWTHGGVQNAGLGPKQKSDFSSFHKIMKIGRSKLVAEVVKFFLSLANDCPSSSGGNEGVITYFTMNAPDEIISRWRQTSCWPPSHLEDKVFYFGVDSAASDHRLSLTQVPPQSEAELAFSAEKGQGPHHCNSRFHTMIFVGDLLNYKMGKYRHHVFMDSKPLDCHLEITGTPYLDLWVSSSHPDADIIVYLEDYDPVTGSVNYVTEGAFRARHRKLYPKAECEGHYQSSVPPDIPFYHTFDEADAEPLVPGEPARLVFEMMPTSYCFQRGSCMRLAFSGSDEQHYLHNVQEGTEIKVVSGPGHESLVHLPIKAYY